MFFLGYNNIRNDSGVVDPQWDCYLDGAQFKSNDAFAYPLNNWVMCEQLSIPDDQHIFTVNATIRNGQPFWFDYILYAPSVNVPLQEKTIFIEAFDTEVEKSMQESKAWQPFGPTANITTIPGTSFKFNFTGIASRIRSAKRKLTLGTRFGLAMVWCYTSWLSSRTIGWIVYHRWRQPSSFQAHRFEPGPWSIAPYRISPQVFRDAAAPSWKPFDRRGVDRRQDTSHGGLPHCSTRFLGCHISSICLAQSRGTLTLCIFKQPIK